MTSTEYWQYRESNVTTDARATHDIPIPANVRMYYFTSMNHLPDDETGACEHKGIGLDYFPLSRALLLRLEGWVRANEQPPASSIPTLASGTLVPESSYAWPKIDGVEPPRQLMNRQWIYDYGPRFRQGILSDGFPKLTRNELPVLVPQVGSDGNELAGIKLPAIAFPVATYAGWNRRRDGAAGVLCALRGSEIPLPKTADEKRATHDSRPSLAELYPDRSTYLADVTQWAHRLVDERLLEAEDVSVVTAEAMNKWDERATGRATLKPSLFD